MLGVFIYRSDRDQKQRDGGCESSVGSVKAGINREASFKDKMPKNHDNVNIPDLRCHVVHFL